MAVVIPPRFMTSPHMMNMGMASSTKLSMPRNIFSMTTISRAILPTATQYTRLEKVMTKTMGIPKNMSTAKTIRAMANGFMGYLLYVSSCHSWQIFAGIWSSILTAPMSREKKGRAQGIWMEAQ